MYTSAWPRPTPSRIREAFRLAEEEKPGATHLEFPEDVASEQTRQHSTVHQPIAEQKAVRAAAKRIESAKAPC